MKKQLISIILLIVLGIAAKAQSTQQEKNIQKLIQVWGLIKYKSPNGVSGKFDADKAFLANIAAIGQADQAACNEKLLALLQENTKGIAPSKLVVDKSLYLTKNLDGGWIKNYPKNLQTELKLLFSYSNPTGKHHYISPDGKNEGLVPNENAYADYNFKNEAMNLLALAKAWAAIEYLFPYKYVIGKDWQTVLTEFIPVFRAVDSRTSYEKAVLMLESAINDTHAGGFLNQLKTTSQIFNIGYYPPFDYQVHDWKIVVKHFLSDSLAQASAIKTGDEILAINGIASKQWLQERSTLLPASNDAVKQRRLSTDLIDGNAFAFGNLPGKMLEVKVRRGDALLELRLEMLELSRQSNIAIINLYLKAKRRETNAIKGFEELNGNIAVIRAGHFFEQSLPADDKAEIAFSKRLKSKKAIIFDMRGYPQAPGLFYHYLPTFLGKPAFKFARCTNRP